MTKSEKAYINNIIMQAASNISKINRDSNLDGIILNDDALYGFAIGIKYAVEPLAMLMDTELPGITYKPNKMQSGPNKRDKNRIRKG